MLPWDAYCIMTNQASVGSACAKRKYRRLLWVGDMAVVEEKTSDNNRRNRLQ